MDKGPAWDKAYIDGDRDSGTTGIQANNIALKADDQLFIQMKPAK